MVTKNQPDLIKTHYKTYKLEIKKTKQNDDEGFFEFEGYASTFLNEDLGGDIVAPGAFTDTIEENGGKIKALWQHNSNEPIGMFEIKEDSIGLFVKGKLPLDDNLVKGRVIPQLKIGSIDTMSIGYRIRKFTRDEEKDVWTLLILDLKEISLVTFAMNEMAISPKTINTPTPNSIFDCLSLILYSYRIIALIM